jgi:hypothetical protein
MESTTTLAATQPSSTHLSQHANPQVAAAFRRFLELPKEVQIKVWKFALALSKRKRTIYLLSQVGHSSPPTVTNPDVATSLLHVSFLARQVAEEVYPMCFSSLPGLEMVRFDSESDFVAFPTTFVWNTTWSQITDSYVFTKEIRDNLHGIQNLVLDFSPNTQEWEDVCKALAVNMPNLKDVIFKKPATTMRVAETLLDVYSRCLESTKTPGFEELTKDEIERIPGMAEGRSKAVQRIANLWHYAATVYNDYQS